MKKERGIKKFRKEKLLDLDIAEYVYAFTEFCETFDFDYCREDIEEIKEYYLTKYLELDERLECDYEE